MKLKETLKSIILTVLVISSFVLSSKIWFAEELWSGDYNSFNYAIKTTFKDIWGAFKGKSKSTATISQVYYPKQFLITFDGKSLLVSSSEDEYQKLFEMSKNKLREIFKVSEFKESTDSEYQKASKRSSLFIDFYNPLSFEVLYDYYNVEAKSSIGDIDNVKHILISLDEKGMASLYVKNNKTNKVYRCQVENNTEEILKYMEKAVEDIDKEAITTSFAFENNFDKKTEGETQKTLLESYMLINLSESKIKGVSSKLISDFSENNTIKSYRELANTFGVSLSSARTYTDIKGTVNLVENHDILKFHKDGLLQYNSVNSGKGIDLNKRVSSSYDAIKASGEFVEKLNKSLNMPSDNSYVLSGVTRSKEGIYKVFFDIFYRGVPVITERKLSDSETMKHAIETEIKDGKIISYNQLLLGFTKNQESYMIPPMIVALDEFYTTYKQVENSETIINDIYGVYYYEPGKKVQVKSAVSLSDGEIFLVGGDL